MPTLALAKKKLGRPSIKTPELLSAILQHVRDGGWIEDFNKEGFEQFPVKSTVYDWMQRDSDFSDAYAQAIAERAHYYVRKAAAISEDDSKDIFIAPNGETRVSHAAVQRSKLIADTYKWLAEKHCPRVYGQRLEQEIKATGTIAVMPIIEIVQRAPIEHRAVAIEHDEED